YTSTPTFNITPITVTSYSGTVSPHQPGGQLTGNSNLGTRMYHSGLRTINGTMHLVGAHTVGDGSGMSRVDWYDFSVGGPNITLLQQGRVNPGNTTDAYMPSMDIDPFGNLGLQFMESSNATFISDYFTGHQLSDAN